MQFQASEAEQQTLRLALAATVAQGYVALLSLDRQLLLTHETVRSRRASLAVAEDRSRMGCTSELEQTQARSGTRQPHNWCRSWSRPSSSRNTPCAA